MAETYRITDITRAEREAYWENYFRNVSFFLIWEIMLERFNLSMCHHPLKGNC